MTGRYGHGNEPSNSRKYREFLGSSKTYQLLGAECAL